MDLAWKQLAPALQVRHRGAAHHKVRRHRQRVRRIMDAFGVDYDNAVAISRSVVATHEALCGAVGRAEARRLATT